MDLQIERTELTHFILTDPSRATDSDITGPHGACLQRTCGGPVVGWRHGSGAWRFVLASLVVAALGSIGCEKEAPIRQYRISTVLPAVLQASDRMLGAIIPTGDTVWFYKVTGPTDAIGFAENDIRQFIGAASFVDGKPQIGPLPNDWVQEKQNRPMRFATVLINTPSKQLELAISSLPKSGDWQDQVAMNVNRWRGQMKLDESTEPWAGATELELAFPTEQPAFWVDLSGEMGAGSAMPPLAGGAFPGGDLAGRDIPGGGMPAAPAGTATPTGTAAPAGDNGGGLKYQAPTDWRAGKMSMMRLAAFDIGPEDQSAELTIIQAGGDLRGNVDRWLGQVLGDAPAAEVVDAALEAAEQLTVSGRPAQRFFLGDEADDSSGAQMIDATIIPMDNGLSMFVKATGPPQTVVAQRDAIAAFLQSLEFAE